MGADGGISWVTLKKEEDRVRVFELLEALSLVGFTSFRDETSEWLDENHVERAIFIPYGTDLYDHFSARDVAEMLEEMDEEEIANDPFRYDFSETTTFEEMALDLATRPSWQMESLLLIEKMVLGHVTYLYVKEENRLERVMEGIPELGDFRNMPVMAWVRELKDKLEKSWGEEETWT